MLVLQGMLQRLPRRGRHGDLQGRVPPPLLPGTATPGLPLQPRLAPTVAACHWTARACGERAAGHPARTPPGPARRRGARQGPAPLRRKARAEPRARPAGPVRRARRARAGRGQLHQGLPPARGRRGGASAAHRRGLRRMPERRMLRPHVDLHRAVARRRRTAQPDGRAPRRRHRPAHHRARTELRGGSDQGPARARRHRSRPQGSLPRARLLGDGDRAGRGRLAAPARRRPGAGRRSGPDPLPRVRDPRRSPPAPGSPGGRRHNRAGVGRLLRRGGQLRLRSPALPDEHAGRRAVPGPRPARHTRPAGADRRIQLPHAGAPARPRPNGHAPRRAARPAPEERHHP